MGKHASNNAGRCALCLPLPGRQFVAVNPAYTAQNCSRCGHRQPMPLDMRVYTCPDCNLVIDRDHNAALNILALGLQRIGIQSVDAPQFIAGE
jgi:putative transposase